MFIIILYLIFLISLIFSLILILKLKIFREYSIVYKAPQIRYGLEGFCDGHFVKANDKGNVNKNWFHKKTLILGYNQLNERGRAKAKFKFNLPDEKILKNQDTIINLEIEAERIHGGLHSHLGPKKKKAQIYLNDIIIDDFYLIQKMPNGEDYGYHNVGPIEIDKNIINHKEFYISLVIDSDMVWDIDKLVLKVITGETRLKNSASMVAGAIISVIIGVLPMLLENLYKLFINSN